MPLPVRAKEPARKLLGEEVYDRLFAAIATGELAPGEILKDAELIDWLGVSRSPIRDALKRLSDLGLVELVPHRYTRVAPVDDRHQLEVVITLYALYELSLTDGLAHLTAADRTLLGAMMREVEAAAAAGERNAMAVATNDYFTLLAERAGNERLIQSMGLLVSQLRLSVADQTILSAPEQALATFGAIDRAVQASDPAAAQAAFQGFAGPGRETFLVMAGHRG